MLQLKDFTSTKGTKYKLQTLPATKGLETFTAIMRIVGEPMGNAAGGVSQTTQGVDLKSEAIGAAVGTLVDRMADPSTLQIVKTLLEDAQVEKMPGTFVPIEFELHWAANYGELVELLAFAIEVNFASFLGASAALKKWAAAALKLIPAGSTGEFGGS